MKDIGDIKQLVLNRKDQCEARAKSAEQLFDNIVLGKHEHGVYDAIMGTLGEMEFLEMLLGALNE